MAKDTRRYSNENRRRWADPEYRARVGARISISLKRRYKRNPGARQALVDRWATPGYRERVAPSLSAGQRARYRRTVEREVISHRMTRTLKGLWADPAYRAARIIQGQRLAADPAYIEKLREAGRQKSQDPEYRERVRDGLVKAWAVPAALERKIRAAREVASRPGERARRVQRSRDAWAADPIKSKAWAKKVAQNSHVGRYEYLDRHGRLWTFKSGDDWERGFGRWLDSLELTWAYEPHVLLLSDGRRYTPDFWVEEWQTYVELKGTHLAPDKAVQAIADGHHVRVLQGLAAIRKFRTAMVEAVP